MKHCFLPTGSPSSILSFPRHQAGHNQENLSEFLCFCQNQEQELRLGLRVGSIYSCLAAGNNQGIQNLQNIKPEKYIKQAGAELCQAKAELLNPTWEGVQILWIGGGG